MNNDIGNLRRATRYFIRDLRHERHGHLCATCRAIRDLKSAASGRTVTKTYPNTAARTGVETGNYRFTESWIQSIPKKVNA